MEKQIEQTLDSREVAEMVEKNHKDLMRDIKRYIKQMSEANTKCEAERNLAPGDFFREDIYKDANNQERPCYCITKKGCEFIAHKLTGTKGTAFTARYINRFHEIMQQYRYRGAGNLKNFAQQCRRREKYWTISAVGWQAVR